MSETGTQTVLRRKARTGRDEHIARVITPARGLRQALARAADDLFDLALSVTSARVNRAGRDAALKMFSNDRLLLVLDGPGGVLGAASVDMAILAGLIEMQTMGKVTSGPPKDREPTQTDAAMVAPLIDDTLRRFVEFLDGEEGADWGEGFRFGARIESVRMLGLLLEAPDFNCFRLDVELGDAAKHGEIVMILPCPVKVAEQEDVEHGEARPGGAALVGEARASLGNGALMVAEARLDAVLYRMRMSLSELGDLKAGDVLNIPREALSETRLEVGKSRPLGVCRLGQINGFRAVRLVPKVGAAGSTEALAVLGHDPFEGEVALDGHKGDTETNVFDISGVGVDPSSGDTGLQALETVESLPPLDGLGDLPEMADLSDLPELDMGEFGDLPD